MLIPRKKVVSCPSCSGSKPISDISDVDSGGDAESFADFVGISAFSSDGCELEKSVCLSSVSRTGLLHDEIAVTSKAVMTVIEIIL